MSTPTHFAAVLRARGRLPEVVIHGPIADRLLVPLAIAMSDASGWGWAKGEMSGHRQESVTSWLHHIRSALRRGSKGCNPAFEAIPLTEAEHAARFPDEAETPMRGGMPVAMFPDPVSSPSTGA